MSKITLLLQCLEDEYCSLRSIVDFYKPAIEPNEPPTEESEIRVYCQKRLCELQAALDNVQIKITKLQEVYQTIIQTYTDAAKAEKKDMLSEIEELKQKNDFRALKQEAENVTMALKTRIREIHTQESILNLNRVRQKVKSPEQDERNSEDKFGDPYGLLQQNHSNRTQFQATECKNSAVHDHESDRVELTSTLKIKYPEVKLPHFDGENTSWDEFWDTYSLIIDQNTQLGDLEKILYLKDAIRGKAYNAIKSIPMQASNYGLIVEVLHRKYGDKGNNRSQIVQRLLRLPKQSATAKDCAETLEKVGDLVFQMVATGYDVRKKHEPFWIDTILSKFPYDIIKDIMKRNSGGDQLTVGVLLDDLNEEISSRALFENRYASLSGIRKDSSQEVRRPTPPKAQGCLFCHRTNHNTVDCRTVKTPIERRNALKGLVVCWKCFAQDHRSRTCTQQNCYKCKGEHHISLCTREQNHSSDGKLQQRNESPSSPGSNSKTATVKDTYRNQSSCMVMSTPQQKVEESTVRSFSHRADGSNIKKQLVLMTAVAQIRNNLTNSFENVLIFLDSGAQCNLIDAHLADMLGLEKSEPYQCTMHGIGGNIETYESQQVTGVFRTRFGDDILINLSTKPLLTNPFPAATLSEQDVQFLKQNQIFLSNTATRGEFVKPAVLIGVESYEQIVFLNSPPTKLPSGLLVQNTAFGQALFGTSKSPKAVTNSSHPITVACPEIIADVRKELRDMYELEGMGISTDEYQAEDTAYDYMNNFSKRITIEHGEITAPFPLKDNVIDLDNNYKVALSRLNALYKFHTTHKEQKDWYVRVLDDYKKDDIIEEIPLAESNDDHKPIFYLPHSGVWRSEKATPLRIVFDASAKAKGRLSLNDVMHTGESFVNKIQDILTASRWCKILVTGDIQAAFTQIRVTREHRDLLRFLWLKDPNQPPFPKNLVHYRFKRLPFGTKASPSILNMTLATFLTRENTNLSKEILDNIYVDNVFLQAETDEEALSKIQESRHLFSRIGMNLREFSSNSQKVNDSIPEVAKGKTGVTKLLGVAYDTVRDELSLHITPSPRQRLTKRELVSEIHKIYDPLGLAIPLLLESKLLMREVVTQKTSWNHSLSKSQVDKWNEICADINDTLIKIPRNIGPPNTDNQGSTLWVFGDASQIAIGCCSYVTHPPYYHTGGLLCAKARLAPLKRNLSIPRLELLAILFSARLAKTILRSYQKRISSLRIVSDSKIALAWILSSRQLPVFVANQVDRINKIRQQIQNTGVVLQFGYIESDHNPADLATRPTTREQFESSAWLKGPRWLGLPIKHWPIESIDRDPVTTHTDDCAQNKDTASCASALRIATPQQGTIIDLTRFRRYSQALRVLTRAMKALAQWTSKFAARTNKHIDTKVLCRFSARGEPTAEEIKLSESILLRAEANQIDIKEIQSKHKDKMLFLDENNIIRAKSRLNNAAFPRDTREPIYLPKKSELVRLIVNEIHETNMHCGRHHTLSLLRMRFWVPQPSATVRKILAQCTICKKEQGLPFPHPEMAPLPKDRVVACKPFQHVGCDYIGPFTTDSSEKVYIALYTCLTTRAIHLEMVDSLSTSAFLDSFLRFISRRGVPSIIRSDCGTNFVLGAKIINYLFEKDQNSGHSVMSYSATKNIKWVFNPPAAPWMGGVWERLVGTVKKCLNSTIRRKRLSLRKLTTVTTCIEAVVNTRPLTKLDPGDLTSLPLRPVDFLQGNLKFSLPRCTDEDESADPTYEDTIITTAEQAKEALKFAEEMADHFWNRWHNEYLTELRDLHKTKFKQGRHISRSVPEVGEIVIVQQDECVPRGYWPLARVTQLVEGSDGLVRTAEVLTQSGNICRRPITKLIPLEIRSKFDVTNTENNELDHEKEAEPSRRVLPPRKAKENVRYQESHLSFSKSFNISSLLKNILYPLMLSLITVVTNAQLISCQNGVATITPLSVNHTLCFNDACQNRASIETSTFTLPPSAHEDSINISVSSHLPQTTVYHSKTCARQSFCANKNMFTLTLLGNPHCSPVGAITTAMVFIAIPILATALLVAWPIKQVVRYSQRKATNRNNEAASFNLRNLQPSKFVSAGIIIAILAVVAASGCEHTSMRHNTEVDCDEAGTCTIEYEQELLFNKLNRKTCILLRYRNQSIGTLQLTLNKVRLSCNKHSLFYTRDTFTEVFYEKRCHFMGSCFADGCASLQNSTVPELREANKYPGYSMCASICGGLPCGCLTPLPSCLFYRVAQVPINEDVYHIFKCTSWSLDAEIILKFVSANTTASSSLYLHPYIQTNIHGWDLKVISAQYTPSPFLSRRFALSTQRQFALSDDFKVAASCPDAKTAAQYFNTCKNEKICACTTNVDNVQCACPQNTFRELKNGTVLLPLITPHFNITTTNTVVTETNDAEVTVLVASKKQIQFAQLVFDPQCSVQFSPVSGCYSCLETAKSTAYCYSEKPREVTLDCKRQSYLITCSQHNETNTLMMEYDHALVEDECTYQCGGQTRKVPVVGTLFYHKSISDHEIFNGKEIRSKYDNWWKDLSFPDFNPLFSTLANHWKLILASTAGLSIISLSLYLCGPAVIIAIIKIFTVIIEATLKLLFACFSELLKVLRSKRGY